MFKILIALCVAIWRYFTETVVCHECGKVVSLKKDGAFECWVPGSKVQWMCWRCEKRIEGEFYAEEAARIEYWQSVAEANARLQEIELSPEEIEAKLNDAWDRDLHPEDEITARERRISELDERVRCECLDERVFGRCCELVNPYEDDEDESVPGYSPNPAQYGDVVDRRTWSKVRSA